MNDKNKEQIMDELFVLASKFSKIVSKSGLCNIWGEVNKIQEDQIKYFLLQEYYFAAPYGFDQYAFCWALIDKRTNEVDKQIHDLIKGYNYHNIDDPDNKNKKSFFDLNPIAQNYVFNGLGEKEINDIIYALDFEALDLFDRLSPIVQKKILALDSCLAQKVSNRNEYRRSKFKGRAAEEVQKNIDNCVVFYKFEQNLYRQKDEIYNDSVVSDEAWKYFYEEDAKGVINKILFVDPKEIDKLLGLDLETSQGASWGVKGKRIKIKDALTMIVEMFPSLFFKLPIEIQDKILDHKYEKGSRSVRESVRSYVELGHSLYNFLFIVTENFLTQDEKKWKKEIEKPYKTNKQNDPNSEKKESPAEKTKPLDNEESKSDTKVEDDKKKEILIDKPEDKQKQEDIKKPDEKDHKHEIIDVSETEDEAKDEDDEKKEITDENLKDKEIQESIKKATENEIILSKKEMNNKIEIIISQVDKFLKTNESKFSPEEVKSNLKTVIELAYACGRLGGGESNKFQWLYYIKKLDKITIGNFLAVLIFTFLDLKKSILKKSDWRLTALERNTSSLIEKLKDTEASKNYVPAQSVNRTEHRNNKLMGF